MMKKIQMILLIMAAMIFAVRGEVNTETLSEPLSDNGEILLWTFADKIIMPGGDQNLEAVLKEDLIEDEAKLEPVGGEQFTFANRTYKWGVVKLVDGYYDLVNDIAEGGQPLDYSTAYLYCVLESDSEQDLTFALQSDDSPKVYLNGKLVFLKYCHRGINQEVDEFAIHLNKGANKLLIRVDNYLGGAGFYGRLITADGEPAAGIKSVVTFKPNVKVWEYKNSLTDITGYVKIPPLPEEPHEDLFGARIQRTMTLLETSTKTRRKKVKILFYGQSIVAEGWHKVILGNLQERYPYAIIEVENRAIGGHTAPVLVRCAAQDLYPFYPDLVVFHVYNGVDSGELERIFYNIRKFTTAEILTFSHHISNFNEKKDEVEADESQYYKYLAQKYDCEFVNVRTEWERYLENYNLEPGDLLSDGIHHNRKGYLLIAKMILKHFKFNTLYPSSWFDKIKTYEARRFFEEKQDEIQFSGDSWKSRGHGWGVVGSKAGDSFKLDFVGNRVDIVVPSRVDNKPFGTAKVLIDGKAPSEFSEIYVATRSSKDIINSRPAIKRVTLGENAIAEDWTFRITSVSEDYSNYTYELIGSVTGSDGTGDKKNVFMSDSGRITLEPRDLAPFYHKKLEIDEMVGFEVTWSVVAMCNDVFRPQLTEDPAVENSVMVVQGLPNTKHTIEVILNGDGQVPIKAIKVFSPPLK